MAPIWNSTGWANITKTIHVMTPTPPHFVDDLEILTVGHGESMKPINCSAFGNPPPRISWTLKPHTSVDGKGRLRFNKVVDESMAGDYVCYASNRLGQNATKTFRITIAPNPSFLIYWIPVVIIVIIILVIYLVWRNRILKKELRKLTREEVEEFHKGTQKAVKPGTDDDEDESNNASIAGRPFDSKLEVDRAQITVGECMDECIFISIFYD